MLFRLNYGGQKFTLVNGISNQHQQQLKANLINNNADSQINTCSQECTKNERKEKLKLKNCFVCFVCERNGLIHIAIPILSIIHVDESENFTTMCDTNKTDVVKCAICHLEAVLISNKFELSKLPHCKLKLTMRHAKKQGARSIQPKFQPVRPGKEDHLKRWTSFFETFPVGPNRSIEFWTEISGNFG